MADGIQSRAIAAGVRGFEAEHNLPPPSTLAAQLVENLSPSTKSSRSDENKELKSLFAIIQQVKDHPELLKTYDERVEHNHMLLYVYARVVLDNIKLEDPFLDSSHVCTEALRAINFLRFTIKETPSVLAYTGKHGFVFRGEEPLWTWLLPRLLRLLGHSKLVQLEGSIEGFLQYLLLVVSRNGVLRESASSMSSYLRAVVSGLMETLQDPRVSPPPFDAELNAKFPSEFALGQIFGRTWSHTAHGITYKVQKASQALTQLWSIVKVMTYTLVSRDRVFSCFLSWKENGPWILDVLLELFPVFKRWRLADSDYYVPLIELTLDITKCMRDEGRFSKDLKTKAYTILILACADVLIQPGSPLNTEQPDQNTELLYCKALLCIAHGSLDDRVVGRLAESKLVNELALLASQHPGLDPGLGHDTDLGKCARILARIASPIPPHVLIMDGPQSVAFQNKDVGFVFDKLRLPTFATNEDVGRTKRVKLSTDAPEPPASFIHRICTLLQIEPASDEIGNLEQSFVNAFLNADEPSQCLALDLLSQVCCMADASSPLRLSEKCTVCDGGSPSQLSDEQQGISDSNKRIVWDSFQQVTRQNSFMESKRPRIAAMIALRRLALHCNSEQFLDLEQSSLGQWCIQSLNSSLRELRIAAGRTLIAFVRPNILPSRAAMANDLIRRNRQNSIALLKSASEKRQPHLTETCIMAWGQLGTVAQEDELNLVLVQLVDYLGDSNNMVSAFAFNELVKLAESRSTTPRRLFEPYWRSLAYLATKDMVQRPQRSRAIAELVQVSINELLLLIQTHALPWLVLDKRNDIIQKITEARQEKDTWRVVMDEMNLGAIIALLLIQDAPDIAEFAKSRLDDISPHFHSNSLLNIIGSEPVIVAMELLMAAGDADQQRKPLVLKALQTVATLMLSNGKDSRGKKGHTARLLQVNLLALMARFIDVINGPVSAQPPVLEQRRCIRALDEMIQICQTHTRIVRPQLSACLLSALSQDALREAAFFCWASMIFNLGEEDVVALLETTFFIVQHYWLTLPSNTAKRVREMVGYLLDNHKNILTDYINRLPSLAGITGLEGIETKLRKLRPGQLDVQSTLATFEQRISHDNSGVVRQALLELVRYLRPHDTAMSISTMNQHSNSIIAKLLRVLLDCVCKYNGNQVEISRLCVECIGLIGCQDSNQMEAFREQPSLVILNNFTKVEEVTDFTLFILEEVLVPAFLSVTDTRLQGFLSFAMQELLDKSEVKAACEAHEAERLDGVDVYRKWITMPEQVREVLTPFLSSRYMVAPMAPTTTPYPIFRPGKTYANWLRLFAVDLLRKGQHGYAELIFEPLRRVIRVKDLSTAEFLLPYLVLHILLGNMSSQEQKDEVVEELKLILQYEPTDNATYAEKEDMMRFCHSVFRVIDYAMRWIQSKRAAGKVSQTDKEQLAVVQRALDSIPAPLISQRAIDCNEYARSLFHLEQYAQNLDQSKREPGERTRLLERLQDIYSNIDEPDGLEGISAHLPALDINQQILSHKKAGRWSAVQTWYEMQLAENPDNVDIQLDLLNCLKQAGQHDVLLNHIEGMHANTSSESKLMPYAVEAAWVTSRWESLSKFTTRFNGNMAQDFNISIAVLFDSLRKGDGKEAIQSTLQQIRENIASSMNESATASLQAAHDQLLRCQVLTDLELIIDANPRSEDDRRNIMALLNGRLEVIGAYFNDKQYLLGIRRAALELTRPKFSQLDISSLWLTSSRLARKTNSLHQSFNAVLHASQLGDDAATIENAKLLWRDNHHRTAIQMLKGAIERNKLMTQTGTTSTGTAGGSKLNQSQKLLTARAQLLLAKWLDAAGQTHTTALRERYQQPPKTFPSWEKGHYYLGRYYKKILESERPLKAEDQSDNFVQGEIARLVIENYVRSLNSGTKYLYQTLPRVLTLWLDMGAQVDKPPEGKASITRELQRRRLEQLNMLHSFLDKYISRLPTFIFYTALPQIVARIAHPNSSVFDRLSRIIVKVVEAHPRQALWSLIGIMTTKQVSDRKARGGRILQSLRSTSKRADDDSYDIKTLLRMGEKLAEQLLFACQNGEFNGNKTVSASLSRDLRFNHKCTPCPLAVPVESSLTATLPAVTELFKKHKAFSQDVVSIECFLDEVLVLSSLAKPRRLTARGSDGKNYMLLIKPKDDLRTDQRLMEFNGMINRSLKRDAESSRRQLYIRTYAVVPLNEECGIIEWVPGIKTMRDILLNLYSSRKIYPDYMTLKQLMEEASLSDSKIRIFTDDVLGRFPPVLHLWFIQQFPSPSGWFAARLRYTRSCAVMSMVGTILGLGDRHGENVNLEEGNGGTFHVDFNCLFDKGLTFAKPERVPFRLTHNMVTAMGIYGFEGPFRKSSELTLAILRQQEETLMTILESFIYDPTLDLQKDKRAAKKGDLAIKLQPQAVVESIKRKVRGLLPHESIPLGVEGQVEELIKQAVDPKNLTAMYIGWCPFL